MRGLVVPDRQEDFTADPVELFFDLAFVFAFSRLVSHLVHHPDWTGAGEAALLFGIIWLGWSWFTWLANSVSGNGRVVRVVFLLATALTIPMAASVEAAFGTGGATFAVSAAAIMLISNVLSVVGHERGSTQWTNAVRLATPTMLSLAILVLGGFLEGTGRVVAWALSLAIIIGGTAVAGRYEWTLRAGHFAERHGLIVIIALGEVVVAIGIAVVNGFADGGSLNTAVKVGLLAAGVFAGLLWWSYFDLVLPALEHHTESLDPRIRGQFARDAYTYSHAPIIGGIIVAAAAAEEILLHPTDHLHSEFRWMFAIGVALFVGGTVLAAYRAFRNVAVERIVAVAAVAIVCAISGSWPAVWILVAADVIFFVMVLFEYRHYVGRQTSETTAPAPAPTP